MGQGAFWSTMDNKRSPFASIQKKIVQEEISPVKELELTPDS